MYTMVVTGDSSCRSFAAAQPFYKFIVLVSLLLAENYYMALIST